MAPIWKGFISFGLVSVPVELVAAVRSHALRFHLLDEEEQSAIRYQRVREADGAEVEWKDIVKAFEVSKGKFVTLSEADFKKAELSTSRSIDLIDFVKVADIDPRYFETPYFLLPSKDGEKAYALLREAIRRSDVVGVGKIILRKRQRLVAVRAVEQALVLEMMRFADEIIDPGEYEFPTAAQLNSAEGKVAQQLVDALLAKFDPTQYTDDYRDTLMRIIRAKAKGKAITLDEAPAPGKDVQVLDLVEKLKQSLAREKGKRSRGDAAARRNGRASTRGAGDAPSVAGTTSRVRKTKRPVSKGQAAKKRTRHLRSA